MSKYILRLFYAAFVSFSICGCSKHLTIKLEGTSSVATFRGENQIHQYPGLPDQGGSNGPFYIVYFSTESDLDGLAKEYTHHLYFSLIPCSQSGHGYDLWNGGVFRAPIYVNGIPKVSENSPRKALYSVYFPTKTESIIRLVKGFGALNSEQYLKTAANDNLCVRVGGGQMWGGSLFSNNLKIPFRFSTESGITEVQ